MSRWSTRPLDLQPGKPLAYRIDLNHASEPQLLQVPGIGEKTANKIEAYRQEHGPFDRVEDLTQIRGIGPATVEKWRGWVRAGSNDFEKDESAPPKAVQAPSAPAKKALAPSQRPNTRKAVSKKEESLTASIDVNRATSQELQRLPGVGPKIAQRIVDERAKAPFQSVDDLRRVSGIGPKILERLRPYVTVKRDPVFRASAD
jgi:competence protein ComEA